MGRFRIPFLVLLFSSLLLPHLLFSQSSSLHGIDLTDLDRKADPCNDFYEFANGTWRANNPIPASMTRWSKRWAAGSRPRTSCKEILDTASADKSAPKGSTEQIIGDYYGACMDESRVNARGMEPLKPWFARIDAAKDMPELQRVMADMHDILVSDPFELGSQQDPHKPSWVLADIGASGLGLPDRDYYLKPEARFKEAREKYVAHITAMFKLAGWDEKTAAAAAQTIMGMETKLAEASLDNVALRDPAATDHNTTFAQLQAMAPHIDWAEYFKHKQIPQDVDMNVDDLGAGGGRGEPRGEPEFEQVAFDHPLWVLYSSGTTGLPKAIVQGHGGIVVEHLKRPGSTSTSARRTGSSGTPPPAG